MRFVSPKVFLIGRPYSDTVAIREWLDHLGVSRDYAIPGDTAGEEIMMVAGKRCYMAFGHGLNPNVQRTREDPKDYIDNVLKSGHGSVLAHLRFNFAIEGISRVCTAELNRHRIGANRFEMVDGDEPDISEGSMRFIRFSDIPVTKPPCLNIDLTQIPENIAVKKAKTIAVFEEAFRHDERMYKQLEEIWKDELDPKSTFKEKKAITSLIRRVVGIGVATGGVWSYSLRALRSMFELRCDDATAEEEIREVAGQMLVLMRQAEPTFFADMDDQGKTPYHKV